MQIDLVPGLPPSGGYENIVTAMDVFSRYLFADTTANQDATTVAKVLINIMTKHAYLPTTLISDKGTAFTSHVIKELAGVLGINLKHATTKHAQTIGLLERSHASIKQSLKIETGERRSLWHKYVSIASYHSSIGCEPSRVFHGRIPYNILDLKMGIRPQKTSSPDSQIAQDVLEQTEMIFQDVRRNVMQAYIKYKAYYDKKANAAKLKQSDYVYILHPKTDHQGSKIPFTDFRWIGPYIIEKVLPNNNYVVRKIGTNKTQILHRMRLRQFTPRQPIPDIPVTPRERQPDPEVTIKHDDLYARAWECENDTPIFDSDRDNLVPPNSHEVTVQFGETADETRSTPGTVQEDSSNIFPHTDEVGDGTDTDHHMQPDADNSVEQIDPTPTNPRSSKYDLRHNPKPNCNDDYRYWTVSQLWCASGTPTATERGFWKSATEHIRNPHMFPHKAPNITFGTIQNYKQCSPSDFPNCRFSNPTFQNHLPSVSQYVSGAPPETPPKFPQNNDYGYNTEYIQAIPNILRIHPGDILNYYSTLWSNNGL